MRLLLDTNVIAESLKRTPEARVVDWLHDAQPLDLHISVLTIGELTTGFEQVPPGKRRDELQSWATHDLTRQFFGRLLPVTDRVAREWGRMTAEGRATGRELPAIDGLLLATAKIHDLAFATRNERDCAGRGVTILNPWK